MSGRNVTASGWLRRIAMCVLLGGGAAWAALHVATGGETPFYARLSRDFVPHTDDWAGVVFYRPPESVPAAFNLLDFFDFDAFGSGAPTTDGFAIIDGESMEPVLVELHGRGAVPVWFVRWSDLRAAMDDDTLTIGELAGLPSLVKGLADFYQETLRRSSRGGFLEIAATGNLADGRTFGLQLASPPGFEAAHVSIAFGD